MNRFWSLCVVLLAAGVGSGSAWAAEAAINLGPEEIIKADGNDIVVPGYSVPSFVDWNNDRLGDLVIGEGGVTTKAFPGKVRVYLNVGTETKPRFQNYFYAQAAGKDLTLTPEGCLGCFPRVVYWDDDKRKDLLVGLADGTVKIFLNIADDNEPAFDGGNSLKVGLTPAANPDAATNLDVGLRATPIVVHWNDDEMLDVVAGGLDGGIHVYYNCGCGGDVPPRFSTTFNPAGSPAQDNGRDLVAPSMRSSPVVIDIDGDNKNDLLTGNTDGLILYYKNFGTPSLPLFSGYSLVKSNGVPIDLPAAQRSRPFVCYWTGAGHFGPRDGYWDLLVGYGDGKVRLYRGLPKPGDVNGDGKIDGDDLTVLAASLDVPMPPEGSCCDLNGDCVVDGCDLRVFADLWFLEHSAEAEDR
jgi:hypothetical protein